MDFSICAPRKKNTVSCYSLNSLKKMATVYNRNNKKNKINVNLNRKKIWLQLNNKLKKKKYCNNENESCWIDKVPYFKNINNDELKYFTFKPKMPSNWKRNMKEWLSTIDIENVMEQYEQKHNEFFFFGAVPIDFDKEYSLNRCIVDEICKISLEELIKDKLTKLGFVFNLDPHDKPGSHWVSMYADLEKMEVYYYDSYGIYPPKEVENLMFRMKEQAKSLNKNMKLYYNDIRHQYKDSECGVYSMNFIIEFLNGKSFKRIIKRIINDDIMNKKRYDYFRIRDSSWLKKNKTKKKY